MARGVKGTDKKKTAALARAEVKEDLGYIIRDFDWDTQLKEQMYQLVGLITEPADQARYPTWKAKASACGLTMPQLEMIRRTPEYKAALQETLRIMALENSAKMVSRAIAYAQDGYDTPSGFVENDPLPTAKLLLETGGAKQPQIVSQQDNRTVNVTLEASLRGLVAGALGQPAVDVPFSKVKK